MKYLHWMLIPALAFAMWGCSMTQSGVNKEYDMNLTAREGSFVFLHVTLDADTRAETLAGDAGAGTTVSPSTALGMQGATSTASGQESFLEGVKNLWDQFIDNSDNSDNSTKPVPPVTPTPVTPPVVEDEGEGDGDVNTPPDTSEVGYENFNGWELLTEAACDDTMSYRECDDCQSVPQDKCLFREYSNCEQLPQSFLVVWTMKDGSQEQLQVPNRCNIAMTNDDMRKYRYIDDKQPHPVAYAPRYMDAEKAAILVNTKK